jgi:hypothetical protein
MKVHELKVGTPFRFMNDIFRVEDDTELEEGHSRQDYIPVTRIASLWPKEANPWLEHDTWFTTATHQIENINPICEVIRVKLKFDGKVVDVKNILTKS